MSFRTIRKKVGIEEEKHQILDMFYYVPLSKFKFNGKKVWNMFDSFYAPQLKDFSEVIAARERRREALEHRDLKQIDS